MHLSILSIIIFVSLRIRFTNQEEDYPEDQPGCPHCKFAPIFYKVHAERKKNPNDNWVCNESFENKIKICVSMFKTMTARKLTTSYKLKSDEKRVRKKCVEKQVTFFEPIGDTDSEFFDPTEVTIGVWMFHCPITKLDLQFPLMDVFPPDDIIKDFYITKGKADDKPIIAVLKNSTYIDNICLKDLWIFDYHRIMSNYTPS